MGDYLKDILASGKKLLSDTKVPKQHITAPSGGKGKIPNPAAGSGIETNPHKILVKRAIGEKLKKNQIKDEIQKLCDAEDARL